MTRFYLTSSLAWLNAANTATFSSGRQDRSAPRPVSPMASRLEEKEEDKDKEQIRMKGIASRLEGGRVHVPNNLTHL